MPAETAALELTENSTSRTVQTKKKKLHFNEAGSGHPVILLHGTGPGATGWSNFGPNIPVLAKHYRVIALDLPGWGKSDPVDPLKEDRQAVHVESVKLLMDELGLKSAALVGNSMGGAVTLQFSVEHNDRLSHCITMGSGLFSVPNVFAPGGMSEGIRIIVETYRDPSPTNFRRLVQVMCYDASFVTDELVNLRSRSALANQEHLDNWLKPFTARGGMPPLGNTELMSKLTQMKTPSIFFHGRDDRVVHMESTLRLVTLVPNSSAHIFNHCGHWAQIEHAKEFNALVHAFLSTH